MNFSSIDILIGDQIYVYTSKETIDWARYLESYKIDPEQILYYDDHKLIIHDFELNDNELKVDEYDNFIRIGRIVMLSKYDMFGMKKLIVGLDPHSISLHENYMLATIFEIMRMVANGYIDTAVAKLNTLYRDYVNRELHLEFYREFNNQSKFKVCSMNYIYLIDTTPDDIRSLDISYNERVIRYLASLIWGVYGKV